MMRSFVGLAGSLCVLVGTVGCGGHSAHEGDDDGAGAASGNDKNHPSTPAAIGLSLSLSQPESTTVDFGARRCSAGGTGQATYTIGMPKPLGTIPSGVEGVVVNCQVTATGHVTAEAAGFDSQTKEKLSLNFSGVLDPSTGAMSTAAVQFYSPQTLALYTDSPVFPECTVGPIAVLKAGAVLTDFSCPLLTATDNATSGCAAEGTIALEYCLTGE